MVTHSWTKMNCYNPARIPQFDEQNGRIIYFACTYTTTFTSAVPTPRYDYNNMVYSLDVNAAAAELER